MLDPKLIPLLRCPATRQPLREATTEEKRERNLPVEQPALITLDGARFYRTEMDFPILLSAIEDVVVG
jgi:uncharacterized protein YbaR (Trm112 family)